MNNIYRILIILIVVVIVYNLLSWYFQKSSKLTSGLSKGTEEQTIQASSLANSSQSSNYSYSLWFYVSDWNYRFGQSKTILSRNDQNDEPCPSIALGSMKNNLEISVACYPTSSTDEDSTSVIHKCNVYNIPIQKWVHLAISLNGQNLDVYIDGKLSKTCVLEGVAKVNPEANVSVTPNGGFSGWTSTVKYYDTEINPQEAYNLYKAGYSGNGLLGQLFGQYKLRVQVIKDGETGTSFEI